MTIKLWSWDSNPQLSGLEPPPITTGTDFLIICFFVKKLKIFKKLKFCKVTTKTGAGKKPKILKFQFFPKLNYEELSCCITLTAFASLK